MKAIDTVLHLAGKVWSLISTGNTWIERRRWLKIIINASLIVIVLLFVYSFVSKDWQSLASLEVQFHLEQAIWAFIAYGINFLLMSQIWHILVNLSGAKVHWIDNYELYAYSSLSRFLPTPVWFLASRVKFYEQKCGISKRSTLFLTFFETVLHFFSGVAVYCLLQVNIQAPLSLLFLLGLLPIILIILYPKQIFSFLSQNDQPIEKRSLQFKMAGIFGIHLITWIVSLLFFRFTIQISSPILLANNRLLEIWILSTLISYVSTYTFGGMGVFREVSLTFLLSRDFSPPVALLITIMVRVVMTLAGVSWSLLLAGYLQLSTKLHLLRRRERLQ